jgi:hypothetical protein
MWFGALKQVKTFCLGLRQGTKLRQGTFRGTIRGVECTGFGRLYLFRPAPLLMPKTGRAEAEV